MNNNPLDNYSSSDSEDLDSAKQQAVHLDCRIAICAKPSAKEVLIHSMPHQDLDKASDKSAKSAPAKTTVQVIGDSGFIIRNALNLHMVVTKENLPQCCDELKKHLKAQGSFAMTSFFDMTDLQGEDLPPKPKIPHLIIRDIKLTCGSKADLQNLSRCSMYKDYFLNPKFAQVHGPEGNKLI